MLITKKMINIIVEESLMKSQKVIVNNISKLEVKESIEKDTLDTKQQ